jgi:hypothetical protein
MTGLITACLIAVANARKFVTDSLLRVDHEKFQHDLENSVRGNG